MRPQEKNPRFSNPLIHSSSPYLRQHAHNPVFWYPWGKEAIDRARAENKPILLSIGYSTCYWCHVMEREVFENLSIASLMNKFFINIKVDREEHPQLDELYMIARQLLTQQGGWPNNVFLTPDLKPFYAGGTFAAEESYGRPSFPRLLEWLNYCWVDQEKDIRAKADEFAVLMQQFAVHPAPEKKTKADINGQAVVLFKSLKEHHDESSGGFFQAPKFPQECYLGFLFNYYEHTGEIKALDIAAHSLGKMAAGGIYDHVAAGFHRYAVDKEWYVPHFEKMLYNQALLASLYTKAAVHTGSAYFRDIAKSILDFTAGPLTDGKGGFYSAIDAETDAVEGAYYAWTPEELQQLLSPEESKFFLSFYALADIPTFPGHKHTEGKVIIARKPLPVVAREVGIAYEEIAALSAQLMNKLLEVRNQRKAPHLDDKIITAWNGLMIAVYAEAGRAFATPRYIDIARKAADYILENGFDEEGQLRRIAGSDNFIEATLEDYAFLMHGLLALYKAAPDALLLETAESLAGRVEELFSDNEGGYFLTQENEYLLFRMKGADDSSIPSANAIMLQNLVALYEITGNQSYLTKAEKLRDYFLTDNDRPLMEFASLLSGALKLEQPGKAVPQTFAAPPDAPEDIVKVEAGLFPADANPGEVCEIIVTLDIAEGWHINAHDVSQPSLVPTQLDVQGGGIEKMDITFPKPLKHGGLPVYQGMVNITARVKIAAEAKKRPQMKVLLRCQPCSATTCHKVLDFSLSL